MEDGWEDKLEEGRPIPLINIKITKVGVSPEKKEELIEGATQLMADVLGKNPATTFVIINEVETDNWGIGESVTRRPNREAKRALNNSQ